MATTQNTFTGNGSNLGPFSFTFKWLESTDIKVTVGGVLKTAGTHYNLQSLNYTTKTGGQVLFTAGNAPANGASIRIYRDTDDEALSAVFSSGSAIRAKDLNDNFTQNLYVTQETNNNSVNIDGSNPMVGPLNMNGNQITNLPVPAVDTNAATKKYVDDRFGNLDIPGHTRWRKVATASQTTFSGTGDYGGVLAYSATREQVYINGALQQRAVDYTADNGTSVVFTVGLTVGDVVDIICVNNLTNSSVSNAGNITYSGQFTGQSARTVAAKLADVVSVKDFGAVGDGVTDDTAAINAALAASDYIFVPPGIYGTTGNHNIKNKSISGVSQDESIIKLLGTNTNDSIFINGENISTPWGNGSGCVLQNLALVGNWDGSTNNAQTNISNIGALFKWWSGAYVRINDCNFTGSFGFGIFCYRLGYSYINGSHIYTNAKNGIHIVAPSGSDSITSSSINFCSIHSCRGRSVDATTGGSAIYLANAFATSVNSCVVEDVDDGFRLAGGDNRSVSLYYLHSEQCSNYDVYYEGAGLDFGMYQCVLGSTNKFYQSDPQYTRYTAINNFGIDDTYELPLVQNGPSQVGINSATPQTTITSVTVGPGTWHLSAGWVGVHSSGTGSASAAQAYAIHNSAAIPGYSSSFNSAVFRGELVSASDQFNCLQGSLSLIRTVTSTTTFYLYGGPTSLSGSLSAVLTGHLRAVKINGPYTS